MGASRFEPAKECRAAQKHPRVEGVVGPKRFPDLYDAVVFEPGLGSIIDVKDAAYVAVDSQYHLILPERTEKQRPGGSGFKNVIGHQQQKVLADHLLCAQYRNAVVLSKIRVLDPCHLDAGEGMALIPLLDGLAAVPHDNNESRSE